MEKPWGSRQPWCNEAPGPRVVRVSWAEPIGYIGVDEKSFRKGHQYMTAVNDLSRGRVLYAAEERKTSSLDGFWLTLLHEQKVGILGGGERSQAVNSE